MSASKTASRAGSKFALDTSCMVAIFAEWHVHHRAASAAYESRLQQGQHLVVAAHAVLECFSVLTRLPAPYTASPDDVERALNELLSAEVEVAGLSGKDCQLALREFSRRGVRGGRVYDATIAVCSFRAGANELLTLNPKDFLAVAPAGLSIVEPN